MEKKLKISLELEDRAFASAIKRMQQQLNSTFSGSAMLQQQRQISQKMHQLGLGGLSSAPTDRQLEQAQNRSKQQSDRIFEETRRKFDIIKRLQNDLNKEQNDLNKEQKSGLVSEQRKLDIKQKLLDLTEKEKRATGELRAQVDRYNAESQKQNKQFGERLTATAGAIGGVGAWIGGQGRLPIEAASAAGSAATFLVGQQLKEMADPSHQAFLPERAKALEAAQKAWKAGRVQDRMYNAVGTIMAATGIGLALEAATLGAATPFLGLAGVGMGILGGTPAQRAITGGNQNAYEKLSSKDLADLAQQSITAEEQADPLKKLAADYYAQNYQRNLDIQRGLGLSDKDFMGRQGFLQRNMAYGGKMQFTEEQVTQQQQAILAAGGSARMGREAGFGLELQKNLNLTNAPQLLGGLSRTLGGAAETKEASIRVISEAFKQGLNDSELADILRGFTQATSEYISRSGAKNQSDVSAISSQFGKGMLENTGVGLEAAKTGFEAFQRLSGSTSGPFGVMQGAGLLKNPVMRKLAGMGEDGAALLAKFQQVPLGQLTENHPVVQEIMYRTGASFDQLQEAKLGAVSSSMSISGGFSKNRKAAEDWLKANPGVDRSKAPANIQSAFRMEAIYPTVQGLGSAPELTKAQDIMSYGAQALPGKAQKFSPEEVLKINSSRMGDQSNANTATVQQVFIDNFENFSKAIVPATFSLDDLTKKIILLGQVIADVNSGKNTDKNALSKAASILGTQPQADSSSARQNR